VNARPARRLRMLVPVVAAVIVVPVTASCALPWSVPAVPAPAAPAAEPGSPASSEAFTFDMPEGWTEKEDTTEPLGNARFERQIVGPRVENVTTNISVLSYERPPGAELEDFADERIDAARARQATSIDQPDEVDGFDGAEGLEFGFRVKSPEDDDVELQTRQVALLQDDRVYIVTLISDKSDTSARKVLDEVGDSWRWS
jgi:hypothetical protein